MAQEPPLIIGYDGLIGHALAKAFEQKNISYLATSRRDTHTQSHILPLNLADDISKWELPCASVVYFCAAVARLQDCHNDPVASRRINVENTTLLAQKFQGRGCHLVFLSTNQVFDGSKPHRLASDTPCPLTEYGQQKAAAEKTFLNFGNNALILRLTKVIPKKFPLFQQWINQLNQNKPIQAFSDMTLSPVLLEDVVAVLIQISKKTHSGILQLSGKQDTSYYDAARCFAKKLRKENTLVQATSSSAMLSEPSPAYTSLDTSEAEKRLGWKPKDIYEILDDSFQNT